MKIKYNSNQSFQLQAISAITSVFEGQPDSADAFDAVLRSRSVYGDQIGLFNEIGAIGNNLLLDDDAILENVKSIQNDNGIAPVEKLNGMHFSVEMETGTGKTYVYTTHSTGNGEIVWFFEVYYHRSEYCYQRGREK